jgi:hypothetical protein
MIKFIANAISLVFNPVIVILPVPFLLVLKTTHDANFALRWSIISYGFIALIVLFVLAGVYFKFFTDFDVSNRKQRTLAYIFSLIAAFLYLLTIILFKGPLVLIIATIGLIAGLIVLGEVNRRIKASVHVATVSAIITAAAIVYGGVAYFALLLIPIIAWSRVKIKRHTPKEALIGGILGVIFTIIVYMMMEVKY